MCKEITFYSPGGLPVLDVFWDCFNLFIYCAHGGRAYVLLMAEIKPTSMKKGGWFKIHIKNSISLATVGTRLITQESFLGVMV